LGVAPALVVVVGSFVMSRACLRETGRPTGDGDKASANGEIVALPSTEDEDRLHRVALKQEAVEELLDGQLRLAEAVDRFEMLSTSAEARANLRTAGRADPEADPAVSQVLAFARVRAATDPRRYAAMLARVEAEAHSPVGPVRVAN
jgi:hypothetical protein